MKKGGSSDPLIPTRVRYYVCTYVINNRARLAAARQAFNPISVLSLLRIADTDKSFRIKVLRRCVRDRNVNYGSKLLSVCPFPGRKPVTVLHFAGLVVLSTFLHPHVKLTGQSMTTKMYFIPITITSDKPTVCDLDVLGKIGKIDCPKHRTGENIVFIPTVLPGLVIRKIGFFRPYYGFCSSPRAKYIMMYTIKFYSIAKRVKYFKMIVFFIIIMLG